MSLKIWVCRGVRSVIASPVYVASSCDYIQSWDLGKGRIDIAFSSSRTRIRQAGYPCRTPPRGNRARRPRCTVASDTIEAMRCHVTRRVVPASRQPPSLIVRSASMPPQVDKLFPCRNYMAMANSDADLISHGELTQKNRRQAETRIVFSCIRRANLA